MTRDFVFAYEPPSRKPRAKACHCVSITPGFVPFSSRGLQKIGFKYSVSKSRIACFNSLGICSLMGHVPLYPSNRGLSKRLDSKDTEALDTESRALISPLTTRIASKSCIESNNASFSALLVFALTNVIVSSL